MNPNQNGVVLTFSVFLLVLAILFFNSLVYENLGSFEQKTELVSLREAGQKYRDIQRSLIDLDFSGEKKSVMERGLPFSYSGNAGNILLSQSFPLPVVSLENYFNSINGYKIFFMQKVLEDLSPEFVLDINSAKNGLWGGSAEKAVFLLQPFCTEYSLGLNTVFVGKNNSPNCLSPFNPGSLQKADFNIRILNILEDYDSLKCNDAACPQNPFNPANSDPFFTINFITDSCPACSVLPATISSHFAIGSDYNIFLSCETEPCNSKPIHLLFNEFFSVTTVSDKAVHLTMQLEFDQNIQSFQTMDFNYSISVPKYGIIRTNNLNSLN